MPGTVEDWSCQCCSQTHRYSSDMRADSQGAAITLERVKCKIHTSYSTWRHTGWGRILHCIYPSLGFKHGFNAFKYKLHPPFSFWKGKPSVFTSDSSIRAISYWITQATTITLRLSVSEALVEFKVSNCKVEVCGYRCFSSNFFHI